MHDHHIAIAGATGRLGLTLLTHLLQHPPIPTTTTTTAASSSSSHHHLHIHILTRSPQISPSSTFTHPLLPHPPPANITLHTHTTSYTLPSLVQILTSHPITLVTSTIELDTPSGSASQIALLRAIAHPDVEVTHVIPSEFCFLATPDLVEVAGMYEHWTENARVLGGVKRAVEASSLHTGEERRVKSVRVVTGWFMDYFGMVQRERSLLRGFRWGVDVEGGRGRLVRKIGGGRVDLREGKGAGEGDGREWWEEHKVAMTWTGDLARFVGGLVGEALGGEKTGWWDKEVVCLVGDKVGLGEVLRLVEGWTQRRFEVEWVDGTGEEGEEVGGKGVKGTDVVGGDGGHEAYFRMFDRMVARGLMDVRRVEELEREREGGEVRDGKVWWVKKEDLDWEMLTVKKMVEMCWEKG